LEDIMSIMPRMGRCLHCGHDHGNGFGDERLLDALKRISELEAALATPAPLSDEPVAEIEEDLPDYGLACEARGWNKAVRAMRRAAPATPSDKQEAVADMENAVLSDERMAGIAPGAVRRVLQVLGDILAAPPAQSAEQDRIDAEPKVRYCPSCGSIGPVDAKYRDCCPDGSDARMVPEKFAEKCRDTFKVAIDAMLKRSAND
jgi:hypothetical protein